MKTWRLAAVLCRSNLSILFKAVETTYNFDQQHRVLPPFHLLVVLNHSGIGLSPIYDTILFSCHDISFLAFLPSRSPPLKCFASKWESSPNSFKAISVSIPCTYQTERMSSARLEPFQNNAASVKVLPAVRERISTILMHSNGSTFSNCALVNMSSNNASNSRSPTTSFLVHPPALGGAMPFLALLGQPFRLVTNIVVR